MKALVAYFSASRGCTASAARALSMAIGADIFEIRPEKPYSRSDLNYLNPFSRCNREHFSHKDVSTDGRAPGNFETYDTVFIGFPIWYGAAPGVVNTFCAGLDFTGKRVALFATSGGSGIGRSAARLQPYVKGAEISDAVMFNKADAASMKAWAEAL